MTGIWCLAASAILTFAAAVASEQECERPPADTLLAWEVFAEGIVTFQTASALGEAADIDVLYYEAGNWCEPVAIDRYEIEGGDPQLEASFVHPVQGQPNLFVMISWPRLHAGINMKGRQYSVFAYQQSATGLELNQFVAGNDELSGGFVGTVDGTEYTFGGTTEEGLITLMRPSVSGPDRHWLPSGPRDEFSACSHTVQTDAQEALDQVQ